jgi:hypothetical protein
VANLFKAIFSASAIRCFSTESAETRLSLRSAKMKRRFRIADIGFRSSNNGHVTVPFFCPDVGIEGRRTRHVNLNGASITLDKPPKHFAGRQREASIATGEPFI